MNDTTSLQRIEPMPSVMEEPRSPQALMRRATDVAGICREIVLKTACEIQGRKFVRVEGWESIATAHGCFAGAEDAERVYDNQGNHIGYKAKGVLRNSHGEIIATGEGFVGFDEKDRKGNPTWKNRAEYAGKAMAQTRAISRTCRGVFAHVVVLIDAGLSTTPAEEIPDGGFDDNVRASRAKQANVPRNVPQADTQGAKGATEQQPKPAQATEKTRAWFLSEMRKAFDDKVILQWACDKGPPYVLMPNQSLEDWPLALVPTTKEALRANILDCAEFMGVEPAPQKPPTTQEAPGGSARPPSTSAAPKQNASETARRSKEGQSEPDHHSAEWYNFPMPWGKKAGTILGKLEKNYLYGLWKNFTVETTYNGKPKKKETIEVDRTFRVMLDMAGVHYKFDEPKGGDHQDSNMGSDPTGGDYDDPPY